jgi:hypothetical protein
LYRPLTAISPAVVKCETRWGTAAFVSRQVTPLRSDLG